MPTMVFNSLNYAKRLEDAGFTRQQAEAQANILSEIIDEKIATKQDLRELELRLKYDLTLRMGTMFAVGIAFLAALLTYLR